MAEAAAAVEDDVQVKALQMDFEKLVADYSDEIISYYDIINVKKRSDHNDRPCDDASSSLWSGSTDPPRPIQWVTLAHWHDLAYQELQFIRIKFVRELVNIEARVKELLTQSSESADKYEPLQIFLEEYLKFLKLSKADLLSLSKNKCYMLMILIKSFVAHFEDSLSSYEYGKHLFLLSYLYKIPELQQQMIIKVLCTNPSFRAESAFSGSARQSEWVRLDDWHDLAHRELTSIRRVYLPQLFKAYKRVCGLWSESPELGAYHLTVEIFLLEFCKFLTLSRAEIVGLSKGECYVFMMLVKNQLWQQLLPTGSQSQIPELHDEVDIRVQFVDLSSGRELGSSDPLHQIQPEWVVQGHQELEYLRNMYSAKLDNLLQEINEFCSQNSVSQNEYGGIRIEVESASNFLSHSRAQIYDISEEAFNDRLKAFKQYMKLPPFSGDLWDELQSTENTRMKLLSLSLNSKVPDLEQSTNNPASTDLSRLIQFKRFTNLNDQLFEEVQLMKKKYMHMLLKAYKIITRLYSKTGNYQKHRFGVCAAIKFLDMPRNSLAILPRDRYELWLTTAKQVVDWSNSSLFPADCSEIKQSDFGYLEVRRSRYEWSEETSCRCSCSPSLPAAVSRS